MPDSPCSTPEARQLDFWLGEWELTWPAEQMGGAQGDLGRGRNSITRLFDDCVIEENFMTDDASYRGHSVSVYGVSAGVWRQTWVDSAGGYLWLTGGEVDGQMILSTEPVEKEAGVAVNRMVFAMSRPTRWSGSGSGATTAGAPGPTCGTSPIVDLEARRERIGCRQRCDQH